MGPRVEQPSEFFPRASRASRRHLEDLADSIHRLPSAAEDLQVIIPRCNRTLLLQGGFRITLLVQHEPFDSTPTFIGQRRPDGSIIIELALDPLFPKPRLLRYIHH